MTKDDFPGFVGRPFHFEWWVDQDGYEFVEPEPEPPGPRPRRALLISGRPPSATIKRKGGPLRSYRPLDDYPGLFLEFAHTRRTPEACIDFTNRFGFLGLSSFGVRPDEIESERFDDWKDSSWGVERMVSCIETALNNSEPLGGLAKSFNEMARPHMRLRMTCKPGGTPEPAVVPDTLYGALWLQVATQISVAKQYRQCKSCSTWFPYGPGTGGRSTKVFCSDRCRTAWKRKRQNEVDGAVS